MNKRKRLAEKGEKKATHREKTKGRANQQRAFEILTNFKAGWISGTKRGTFLDDKNNIDFFIIHPDYGEIPIQTKSSFTGVLEHRNKNLNIPVICVGSRTSRGRVINDTAKAATWYIKSVLKM